MPYCFPSACQPDTVEPRLPIHGWTSWVRSLSLPALAWSAISPPPHCWNRSGGLWPCSATAIFERSCSFWIATTLTVTFGCAAWYSLATLAQKSRPGFWLALCHQVSFTGLFELDPSLLEPPPPQPLRAITSATPPASNHQCRLAPVMMATSFSVRIIAKRSLTCRHGSVNRYRYRYR